MYTQNTMSKSDNAYKMKPDTLFFTSRWGEKAFYVTHPWGNVCFCPLCVLLLQDLNKTNPKQHAEFNLYLSGSSIIKFPQTVQPNAR